MVVRVVFVILVVAIVGTAAILGLNGVWGQNSNVVSTRVGSPGGGYGLGGGVK
jgi:hypothetical protein